MPRKFSSLPTAASSPVSVPKAHGTLPRPAGQMSPQDGSLVAMGAGRMSLPAAVKQLDGTRNLGNEPRRLRGPEPTKPASMIERQPADVRMYENVPTGG